MYNVERRSSSESFEMSSVKLIDGGFSTQLTFYVGDIVDGDPLWSAKFLETNKDDCIKTHRDFIRAGADIIMTNSYQASVEGFKTYLNLDREDSIDLMKQSVDFVKKAIDLELGNDYGENRREVLIAGSVGPYGAGLHDGSEYRGEYVETTSARVMAAWHKPRIEALIAAGVDVLAFETIPALAEAEMLIQLLKNYPHMKAWLSFSCKDDLHTSYGERLSNVAARCWAINPQQIIAIGVNCLHPGLCYPLLKSVRKQVPSIPLICYPNSGERYDAAQGKWLEKSMCVPISNYLSSWLDLGVEYIGGCCRTDASDTKQFRHLIDGWLKCKNNELTK